MVTGGTTTDSDATTGAAGAIDAAAVDGRRGRRGRPILTLALLLVAAAVAIGIGATVGSVTVSWHDLISFTVTGRTAGPGNAVLLGEIRMPRVITAATVGAGLGIAGLLMQTLFANPLADPYILGVSSGASLGVALVTLGPGR